MLLYNGMRSRGDPCSRFDGVSLFEWRGAVKTSLCLKDDPSIVSSRALGGICPQWTEGTVTYSCAGMSGSKKEKWWWSFRGGRLHRAEGVRSALPLRLPLSLSVAACEALPESHDHDTYGLPD